MDTVDFINLPETGSKDLEVRIFEQTNEECRSFCSDFAVHLFCILSSLLATSWGGLGVKLNLLQTLSTSLWT
jgi:hypothetical protein